MGLFDIFRRRKSGTASPSPDSKRGDWMKWFLNREALGGMKFNPGPGGYIDYSPFFQRGGSVNPFEETRQAAQDWSPREQYISRSNQDRIMPVAGKMANMHRNVEGINWRNYIGPDIRVGGGPGIGNIERANMNIPWRMPPGPGEGFIQRPGRPEEGRGGIGPDSFWNVKANQLDNAGIMTADAGNIMNKYKQFTEKFSDFDIGRDGIEYEKDFDIPWGGTGTFEGYGGGDDYGAGINFNWPLGWST